MSTASWKPVNVPIQQDRTLLNSKFEGYKLSFLNPACQHFVPALNDSLGVIVPKLSAAAKLSYREVQNRIRHNHLHPGWNTTKPANGDGLQRSGVAFTIDAEFMLTSVSFDKAKKRLSFKKLIALPTPTTPINFHLEFPSVRPLCEELLLVSDGAGTFYIIRLRFNSGQYHARIVVKTTFNGIYMDQQPSWPADSTGIDTPCGLLDAKVFDLAGGKKEIRWLIHHTPDQQPFFSAEPSPHHRTDSKTVFVVCLLSIPWESMLGRGRSNSISSDSSMDADGPGPVLDMDSIPSVSSTVIHSLRGTELPFYCAFDPSGTGYVIGSHTVYRPTVEQPQEQKVRYLEPGSEAMEVDGVDVNLTLAAAAGDEPSRKDSPYIWTQTETDITVCFTLPREAALSKAVQCKFFRQAISISVDTKKNLEERLQLPSFNKTELFDLIRPDESVWTLEPATGLLTLNIEKKHDKTRWQQLFADGVEAEPVEETLDPSVFAEYRAAMEKYTTDVANAGAAGSSIIPSIAQDAQEDIDEEGEEIKFSWVDSRLGHDIIRATTLAGGHDWIGQEFPNFDPHGESLFRMPTVCLKHDVDGLVYQIQHAPTVAEAPYRDILKFIHTSTFDALAFVQASKREKRFVFHDPHYRFSVIAESSRNVYIYFHTVEQKLQQERQMVVDISRGEQVDIIGCQLVCDGILVILLEGRVGAVAIDLFERV